MMPLGVSVGEEECTEMEEVLEAEAATHGVLVGITSQIPVGVEAAHTTLVMSKVTIAVLTTRDISLCLSRGLAEEAFQHVSSQGSCPKALSEFFQLYSERTHLKSNETLFERVFLFKGYSVKISRLTRVNDCT